MARASSQIFQRSTPAASKKSRQRSIGGEDWGEERNRELEPLMELKREIDRKVGGWAMSKAAWIEGQA